MNDHEMNVCGADYDDVKKPFEIIGNNFYFESWLYDVYINECIDSENDPDDSEQEIISIPLNEPLLKGYSNMFIEYFYADIWYPIIAEYTIPSYLVKLSENDVKYMITNHNAPTTVYERIEDILLKAPTPKFYRLNSLSSKYKGKLDMDDAIKHMFTSNRIISTISSQTSPYIFIREFIDLTMYDEYRCFIKNRTLLGVSRYYTDSDSMDTSNSNYLSNKDKISLIKFVKKIISELDIYNDFTIDIAFSPSNIFVIEINSPVYMMAGSCYFTLFDIKNVIDKKHENISYPIFKGVKE